jgi:anti-sigma-K factor RskA
MLETAATGDWRKAGVDLTALAAGLVLAGAAALVRQRRTEAAVAAPEVEEAAGAA